jgi:hypothetical protein
LDLISAELDTDTIVEVYFMNNLGTTRDWSKKNSR